MGRTRTMCVRNVPNLSFISLWSSPCQRPNPILKFHRDLQLSRMKKLELDLICIDQEYKPDGCTNSFRTRYCVYGSPLEVYAEHNRDGCMDLFPRGFPAEFSNLEELKLKFIATEKESLLSLSSIIAASPNLHKLTLKYTIKKTMEEEVVVEEEEEEEPVMDDEEEEEEEPVMDDEEDIKMDDEEEEEEEIEEEIHTPSTITHHECLKAIEFVGWVGLKNEVELADYFIQIATNLEKIILDRRTPHFMETCGEFCDPIPMEDTTKDEAAMQLEERLSPKSKLILV